MFHPGSLPVLFVPGYTVSHSVVVGGQGYWPGIGRGVPFSVVVVFPGGLPEWSHLSKLGLGSGCSGLCGCPVVFVLRSVSGNTIVLEGIVLCPTGLPPVMSVWA